MSRQGVVELVDGIFTLHINRGTSETLVLGWEANAIFFI